MSINILVSNIVVKFLKFWVFLNTEMIKTDTCEKRKCYDLSFLFFNILTMTLSSYYEIMFGVEICGFTIIALEDIVLFIFFTKPQVLPFYLYFVPRLFTYICYCFINFWTKYIFWKIINCIYDWYMIYPHFVIWKKIIKM